MCKPFGQAPAHPCPKMADKPPSDPNRNIASENKKIASKNRSTNGEGDVRTKTMRTALLDANRPNDMHHAWPLHIGSTSALHQLCIAPYRLYIVSTSALHQLAPNALERYGHMDMHLAMCPGSAGNHWPTRTHAAPTLVVPCGIPISASQM